MWDVLQSKVRQEELLRQAEQFRRQQQLLSATSHNYLPIVRSSVARTLIQVGLSLVRR